jgi:hypothetical protein
LVVPGIRTYEIYPEAVRQWAYKVRLQVISDENIPRASILEILLFVDVREGELGCGCGANWPGSYSIFRVYLYVKGG